ncbi:MAG: hypothetical protein ACREQ4_15150 [Candidatus Binataceae bacterium]
MRRWKIASAITLSFLLSMTPSLVAQDNGGDGAAPIYRDYGPNAQSSPTAGDTSGQAQSGAAVKQDNPDSGVNAGDADSDNQQTNSVNSGGDLSGPRQEPNFQNQPPPDNTPDN